MPIPSYPEFFNDVFGPIMQPGSSSHTAGPCRIGYLTRSLLGEDLHSMHVLLDANGSFAGTFGIMAEDRGMIAGALGFLPDDERLFDAFAIADQAGIAYRFEFDELTESRHPNAIKFMLTGTSGRSVTLVADSTGGGMIETRVVDGYPLRTNGDAHVLLVFDPADALLVARFRARSHGPARFGGDRSQQSRGAGEAALGQAGRAARPGDDQASIARLSRGHPRSDPAGAG